jgi:hypothetical protein
VYSWEPNEERLRFAWKNFYFAIRMRRQNISAGAFGSTISENPQWLFCGSAQSLVPSNCLAKSLRNPIRREQHADQHEPQDRGLGNSGKSGGFP